MTKKKTVNPNENSNVKYKFENGFHSFKYKDQVITLPEDEYWKFIRLITYNVMMSGLEVLDKVYAMRTKSSYPADSEESEIKDDDGNEYKVS